MNWKIEQPKGGPDLYPLACLLDQGELLDLEFNQWHRGLPDEWLPRKFRSSMGNALVLYLDVTSAGGWNYYPGTRIIL